jgi:DNA-directed RNA polymerase specialized sigma24 family protein
VSVVLDDGAARLDRVWPETSRRLAAFLRSRGVPSDAIEDIAQEVAIRALRSRVAFEDANDLLPWACTVAWRLHIGDLRRRKARPSEAAIGVLGEEIPASGSVEDEVAARLRLSQVVAAMSTLPVRDQQLLTAAAAGEGTAVEQHEARRLALLRFRARARLVRALGAGAAVVAALRRVRWQGVLVACTAAVAVTSLTFIHTPSAPHDSVPEPPAVLGTALLHSPVVVTTVVDRPTVLPVHAPPRAAPARVLTTSPPTTVLFQVRTPAHPLVQVTSRPKRASDHLFCTGKSIVLPGLCLG